LIPTVSGKGIDEGFFEIGETFFVLKGNVLGVQVYDFWTQPVVGQIVAKARGQGKAEKECGFQGFGLGRCYARGKNPSAMNLTVVLQSYDK
tara:strand:- start:396 stop:668 length:273 start_codon:yes stop_codon:yes gene_type:complete